jgi:hypothetical protein
MGRSGCDVSALVLREPKCDCNYSKTILFFCGCCRLPFMPHHGALRQRRNCGAHLLHPETSPHLDCTSRNLQLHKNLTSAHCSIDPRLTPCFSLQRDPSTRVLTTLHAKGNIRLVFLHRPGRQSCLLYHLLCFYSWRWDPFRGPIGERGTHTKESSLPLKGPLIVRPTEPHSLGFVSLATGSVERAIIQLTTSCVNESLSGLGSSCTGMVSHVHESYEGILRR